MVQPSSVTLSLNTIVRVHKGELIKDIPFRRMFWLCLITNNFGLQFPQPPLQPGIGHAVFIGYLKKLEDLRGGERERKKTNKGVAYPLE